MEFKLETKTILEKEFKQVIRGYKQEEVDWFLDDVIQDYETFKKEIARLQEENTRLKAEVNSSQRRSTTPAPQTTNIDIIQRIANLEREVFGDKLAED